MSMIGILIRVTKAQLDNFIADSTSLEEFADSEDLEESRKQLYLDKSWDAINFLLTGQSLEVLTAANPPLNFFFSGQLVDEDQDMGYGPAQYFNPSQVTDVNKLLSSISGEEFRKLYDPNKLNENNVYPNSWSEDEDESEYLVKYFEDLKAFYSAAVKEREAIVTFIS